MSQTLAQDDSKPNEEDYYSILQVDEKASTATIVAAYKRLAKKVHPDKNNQDDQSRKEAQVAFESVKIAYDVLTDPKRREVYDCRKRLKDSTVYENVPLNDCQEQDSFYSYNCRCSGNFLLDKSHLRFPDSKNDAFIVECDSCSNTIKIVV